jgi:hypothetical protein
MACSIIDDELNNINLLVIMLITTMGMIISANEIFLKLFNSIYFLFLGIIWIPNYVFSCWNQASTV